MIGGTIKPEMRGPKGYESAYYDVGWVDLGEDGNFRIAWTVSSFLQVREALCIYQGDSRSTEPIATAPAKRLRRPRAFKMELSHAGSFEVVVVDDQIYWGPQREKLSRGFVPKGSNGYQFQCGHCTASYRAYESTLRFTCRKEAELIPGLFAVWYTHSGGILPNED